MYKITFFALLISTSSAILISANIAEARDSHNRFNSANSGASQTFYAQHLFDPMLNNDVISVYDRQRPGYEAKGRHIGAFTAFGDLVTSIKSDDNIFATQQNREGDIIGVISPTATLKSNWNNHALIFSTGADINKYKSSNSEDHTNINLLSYGRLDVMRGSFVDGSIEFNRTHEDRGSPDDAGGIEPTEIDELQAQLGFSRKVGKISLDTSIEGKKLDYKNVLTTTGFIDNFNRDRNEYQVGGKISYELIPNYEAFIQGTYNIREYDNVGTFDRDSEGFDITLGTDIDFSGKVRGSLHLGYLEQKYDDSALDNIDGVTFGGDLLWNATDLTSLLAGVSHSVEETILSTSSGYLSTSFHIGVEHELQRNWLFNSNIALRLNDYEGTNALQREDEIKIFNIGTSHLIDRGITTSIDYSLTDKDSNITNGDYNDNRIILSLSLSI